MSSAQLAAASPARVATAGNPGRVLSRDVDAVIDARASERAPEHAQASEDARASEHTPRRGRALSDSSIHTTFLEHGATPAPMEERAEEPQGTLSVLQAFGRRVQGLRDAAGSTLGGTSAGSTRPRLAGLFPDMAAWVEAEAPNTGALYVGSARAEPGVQRLVWDHDGQRGM